MGPCFRRDDGRGCDCQTAKSSLRATGSARVALPHINVVPAKAGTHNHRPVCLRTNRSTALLNRNGTAYGSDRKSTRLNSSHTVNSYAVFCLKKKSANTRTPYTARSGDSADRLRPAGV